MNSAEPHAAIDSLATAHGRQLWETMQDVFAAAPGHLAVVDYELPSLLDAGNRGSVIARDHLVRTLALLMADRRFAGNAVPNHLAILEDAPDNQFPMYAEPGGPVLPESALDEFERILRERLGLLTEPKQRRVNAVLRRLGQG
ncbi:hypothetical protein [Aeromicrobium sp.]